MENKHTPYDLAQMQSLPLEAKIRMAKMRIRQWYDHWDGMVYVSFSGGKDSTVLKHLVDSMYYDVPALFVNTGLEYPEIQNFVRDIKNGNFDCFNSDIEIVRPVMRFDEVIKTYGYPAISKEVSPNRFQRLRETHPRQYEYCINGGECVDGKWQPSKEGLGLGKVLEYIGVDYK